MISLISFESAVVPRASLITELSVVVTLETEHVAFFLLEGNSIVFRVAGSFIGWSVCTCIINGNQFCVGHQGAIVIPADWFLMIFKIDLPIMLNGGNA